MAKSEYQRYLEEPFVVDAHRIAENAHDRVYEFFESLTDDEKMPDATKEVVARARILFYRRATARLVSRENWKTKI